jgi:hypothetical protein
MIMILNEKISELKKVAFTPDRDSLRLKVPVLQADVENANKRRYPMKVVQDAVEELRAKLKKQTAFGSTRHEKDLEVDQVSHMLESVSLDEKTGLVTAILRIFGTTKGRNLASILRGGGALGVSARGVGETKKEGKVEVIQPGYRLLGVDFTLDPAFSFHVGKEAMVFESRSVEEDDGAVTEKELMEMGAEPFEYGALTKEQLTDRFFFALSAGYKGTFQQYCESLHSKKG